MLFWERILSFSPSFLFHPLHLSTEFLLVGLTEVCRCSTHKKEFSLQNGLQVSHSQAHISSCSSFEGVLGQVLLSVY